MPSTLGKSVFTGSMGGFTHMEEYPKKTKEGIHEGTLDAVWCVDSETSERVLMDRRTNKEIGRWKKKEDDNGTNT